MAKKKTTTWYGIRCNTYDMVISEAEVIKETETRIYLDEITKDSLGYRAQFFNKKSKYEEWYPTRDEAVQAKLRYLQQKVKGNKEEARRLKLRLSEFKEAEGL